MGAGVSVLMRWEWFCVWGLEGKPVIVMRGLSLEVQDLGCSQEGGAAGRGQQESRVPHLVFREQEVTGMPGVAHTKSNKGSKVCGCHYPGGRHGLCDWN